jgi:hypothetical protein
MKKSLLSIFLIIINFTVLFSQVGDIPIFKTNEIPNSQITRTDFYNGDELFGYIDGGADLYLEYGFSKLAVQEIIRKNETVKIEYFRMKTAEAAYGIFSISKNNCTVLANIKVFNCVSPHQILFTSGRNFASVTNTSGSIEAQKLALEVSKIVSEKFLPKNPRTVEYILPVLFRSENLNSYISNLKFMAGSIGLQNGFPKWTYFFEGIDKFSLYVMPIETDEGYINIAEIDFQSQESQLKFIENTKIKDNPLKTTKKLEKDGIFYLYNKQKLNKIYFVESNLPKEKLKKFTDIINFTIE